MEVSAADLAVLTRAAVAAHRRLLASASEMTDAECRAPSLLPGWSRGHVLAHWARNADGQTRMLLAAARGEVARLTERLGVQGAIVGAQLHVEQLAHAQLHRVRQLARDDDFGLAGAHESRVEIGGGGGRSAPRRAA